MIRKMNEQPKVSGSYLFFLRVTLGLSFIGTWVSNLMKGVFTDPEKYVGTIKYFTEHPDHIANPADIILETIIFPNATIFMIGWFVVELVIGLSLVFGILTRLGGVLGSIMSIILLSGAIGVDWIFTYLLLIVGFFTCAWASAGKWYGIDFFLKDIIPGKIERFLI
jgi:uncharacterized membrane protein YphA (DoxX/SURF4 family)